MVTRRCGVRLGSSRKSLQRVLNQRRMCEWCGLARRCDASWVVGETLPAKDRFMHSVGAVHGGVVEHRCDASLDIRDSLPASVATLDARGRRARCGGRAAVRTLSRYEEIWNRASGVNRASACTSHGLAVARPCDASVVLGETLPVKRSVAGSVHEQLML